MAFASLDFLPVVKPSCRSTHLGGLHRLTIKTPRPGMFVPRLFCSDARAEGIVDSDPHPLAFPGTQVMIDALPLGEIGGQHAPLDPAFGHIKDGIEHGPHTEGTRSSTAFSGRDQLFDPFPLLVGQVAWICFFVHISMLHNPRRLFRQALRSDRVVTSLIVRRFCSLSNVPLAVSLTKRVPKNCSSVSLSLISTPFASRW